MPLNSFSWSICWAFGAKCSWQNFVMVCLSWEKSEEKCTCYTPSIYHLLPWDTPSIHHWVILWSQTHKHKIIEKSLFQVISWNITQKALSFLKSGFDRSPSLKFSRGNWSSPWHPSKNDTWERHMLLNYCLPALGLQGKLSKLTSRAYDSLSSLSTCSAFHLILWARLQ